MINISRKKKILAIYILLTVVTLAVLGQVLHFDFISFDDPIYVTGNRSIQSPMTLQGLRWAFTNTQAQFWHPLTWVSLMLDYQLYGLSPAGYHLTNLILHLFNTLLLFWLFHRMTNEIWKSAMVAALFAWHPLHVETVAWIAKRKDVLSAFGEILSLCAYVYYTEKPGAKRYGLVLFSFILALMSKPMAVTLPVVMILLDYWPLQRLTLRKENISWQVKEKTLFFILAAVFSFLTVYIRYSLKNPFVQGISFSQRLANAPVAFVTYLKKTFLPCDLAIFYPLPSEISMIHALAAMLLIVIISALVIATIKKMPFLFVGWSWYAITILPVIGLIQVSERAGSDNYTYLPLIGLTVMFVWGVPFCFTHQTVRKRILFPAATTILALMSTMTWKQCTSWQDSLTVFRHACAVTSNNFLAHNNLATVLSEQGKNEEAVYHFNQVIRIRPFFSEGYYNRGTAYGELGLYDLAIADLQKAISLNPDFVDAYYNLGTIYARLDQYNLAIKKYNKVISIDPHHLLAYYSRGVAHLLLGRDKEGCRDAYQACVLGNCTLLEINRKKKRCP
jgi:hypothetical protein